MSPVVTVVQRNRAAALLFGAALLLVSSRTPATWNKVAQFNGMGRVSASYFFDGQTGFIGFNGLTSTSSPIKRTIDGGMTWQDVRTPTVNPGSIWISDIWFRTATEGWATFFYTTSNGKNLWHTTDGGLNWSATGVTGSFTSVRQTSAALITAPDKRDPALMKKLDAVAGRVLKA